MCVCVSYELMIIDDNYLLIDDIIRTARRGLRTTAGDARVNVILFPKFRSATHHTATADE